MQDKEFYTSKKVDKYPPDGRIPICKKCLTMHVNNWDPETYMWILEEVDVPYIKKEWDALLQKFCTPGKPITGLTIIGRYLSKMKLKQWSSYCYADTERLQEEEDAKKRSSMKAQGLTDEEIESEMAIDRTPERPPLPSSLAAEFEEEEDEFADALTEEEKTRMRLKWGNAYRVGEWVRLERLYEDMMNSYDIQSAGHKDTLIMICKASLKANQLIDAGDIDGFQKMSRVYDSLMKSGKFKLWTVKDFSQLLLRVYFLVG